MINATPLLRLYARWRTQQLQNSRPAHTQRTQLLSLLRTARATQFGVDHGFAAIGSVEEYQRRVPLRRYEQFWEEYWRPAFPRLVDCTWPGQIQYFPVSSGTSSGTTKYIPCSQAMLASNRKAGIDLLVHHLNNRPHSQIFGGRSFMLGGSTELSSPAADVFLGDLSGIAVKTLPWWARARYFPPAELALLKNWEEKISTLAQRSLHEDIRMFSGVPAWMLLFFEALHKLRPNHEGLRQIWPNLELVVHGGVNFAPYLDRFRTILADSPAELREVYPASEGFIGIADRGYGEGLRLNLDVGIFYEFVPLEELDSPTPTRHWIENVQPDINYAIVLTTCAGLWCYIIGDTVRFVDTATPRVLVTGRTSYYLSAFGEHLIAEEIEDGIATAARSIGVEVRDFTVGPIFPQQDGELGGHLFVVEFNGEDGRAVLSPERCATFAEALDKRLCERNEDYDAHRANGYALRAPTIITMPAGGFAAWMKSRGKLGGQHKVPRIILDPERLSQVVEFARQHEAAA
jgi:hypothetical protein